MTPLPLQFALVLLAGWLSKHQQEVIEYLQEENRNPFGARLRAVISSDIGHWDVIEMERVLEEAWEGVEKGVLTEADLRAFTFEHPVALHGRANPDFFEGTSVETAAREWLAD